MNSYTSKTTHLSECPSILQEKVDNYLYVFKDSKLLRVEEKYQELYNDKTIGTTAYCAYLIHGNLFTVMKFSICTKPEWSDTKVRESSMIAGDISVFLQEMPEWFTIYKISEDI